MSYMDLDIGFVGAGHMGRAIIAGLVSAGPTPARIRAADPSAEQRTRLQAIHPDLQVSDDNALPATASQVLVLAVKPQVMEAALTPLRSIERADDQLVISIAAGVTLTQLEEWLGTGRAIVRAMPNQPALVNAGMSILTASPTTSPVQRDQATYVAEAMGEACWIDDESLMDAVTAVSGSGPAYFYLLMEMMEDCAREMGLPADLARILARQTGLGAGLVARDATESAAELRESVTSPGGTTAAAVAVLEAAGFRDIFRKALAAARDRSMNLGEAGS